MKKKRFGKIAVATVAASALMVASVPAFAAAPHAEGAAEITSASTALQAGADKALTALKVADAEEKDDSDSKGRDTEVDPDDIDWDDIDWDIDRDDADRETDYGDLTDAEIKELEDIYARYDAILEDILGVDLDQMIESAFSGDETSVFGMDEAELEKKLEDGLKKYEKELEQLEKRAEELEKKAGWDYDLSGEDIPFASYEWEGSLDDLGDIDLSDLFDINEEDLDAIFDFDEKDVEEFLDSCGDELKGILNITAEDINAVKDIYQQAKDLGLISIIFDKDTTEESLENFVTEHEAELTRLAEDATDLLEKIFGEE